MTRFSARGAYLLFLFVFRYLGTGRLFLFCKTVEWANKVNFDDPTVISVWISYSLKKRKERWLVIWNSQIFKVMHTPFSNEFTIFKASSGKTAGQGYSLSSNS